MTAAIVTASASVIVAMLIFVLNQHAQIRQEQRQVRLDRLENQLRKLYGPLNSLIDVNERIWQALRESRVPAKLERSPEGGSDEWRRWRDLALMPTNHKMVNLIIENADLLIETEVPKVVSDFCAHVTSLEVVVAAESDGEKQRTLIAHPGAQWVDYVRSRFKVLKGEQNDLLRGGYFGRRPTSK